MSNEHSKPLTASEIERVKQRAGAVGDATRRAFDEAFRRWKASWFTGPAALSSDTRSNRKLPDYAVLLGMGQVILPLVADRLAEPDNFPALVLFDELAAGSPHAALVAAAAPEEGEQSRAIRSLRAYLDAR